MAEAFFNQMTMGKAQALSAGTQPAAHVNPIVIEAMREVGIDVSNNKLKALTLNMVEQADRVITMGCEAEAACPAIFVETEDWGLEDPKGKSLAEVRKIRNEIEKRVIKLIQELGLRRHGDA